MVDLKPMFAYLIIFGMGASAVSAQTAMPANTKADNGSTTLVPRGTIVVVQTTRGTNSYGAETGAKVTYTLVQDVIVDGNVVAKTGDVAEGAVQNSEAGTIETDFMRSEYRRRQGFLGNHKDVEVVRGQMYQVPTERPQRVCSEPTSEAPQPIPSDALQGDKN
jgi:hypothetical protein